MEAYLRDPDLTIFNGDVRYALGFIPDESVDCVVTSPPYWGLRDYGVDDQIGLETTPDEYVFSMVGVFRQIRRVLALHGTVWLNLGDSYVSDPVKGERMAQVRDNKAVHDDVIRPYGVDGLQPKNLTGIPWKVAFALQEDGWFLRSDIIWAKPNPMPESIKDRPTKSHEYVFLLTKNSKYYFDQEAVREPAEWKRWGTQTTPKYEGTETGTGWIKTKTKEELLQVNPAGRNIRSVWLIPTQPYADAHFATYPIELPRRAISAGCPKQVCTTCGEPRRRIVERDTAPAEIREKDSTTLEPSENQDYRIHNFSGQRYQDWLEDHPPETVGWTDCGHDSYRTGVVLDPFFGAGTTALAARELQRNCYGIELNEEYCAIAAKRLQQLSLLSDVAES